MQNNKGFTLVEILVVVAILALLAGVSTYSLSLVTNSRNDSAAVRFAALLTSCKVAEMSGARNPEVGFELREDGYYGVLYVEDESGALTQADEEQIYGDSLEIVLSPENLQWNTVRFAFDETGALEKPQTSGQVDLTFGTTTVEVTAATGYIYVN